MPKITLEKRPSGWKDFVDETKIAVLDTRPVTGFVVSSGIVSSKFNGVTSFMVIPFIMYSFLLN